MRGKEPFSVSAADDRGDPAVLHRPVCTENLSSGAVAVKSGKDGV